MRRPVLAVALLAVALSGCGAQAEDEADTSRFQGEARRVADAVEAFETSATQRDPGEELCNDRFSNELRESFEPQSCVDEVETALNDADDYELEVRSVSVEGTNASAVVRSLEGGEERDRTLRLVRQGSSWRIAAFR